MKGNMTIPSVATAEKGDGSHIGYFDILELIKEVLSLPHSNPETSNTEEVETMESVVNEDVLLEKPVGGEIL